MHEDQLKRYCVMLTRFDEHGDKIPRVTSFNAENKIQAKLIGDLACVDSNSIVLFEEKKVEEKV